MARLQTTNGYFFEIDDEDVELVTQFKWFYARNTQQILRTTRPVIALKRYLKEAKTEEQISLRDKNPFNLRRRNLVSYPNKVMALIRCETWRSKYRTAPPPLKFTTPFNDNDEFERAFARASGDM